ncbi:hypothetical protein [Anaerolinea sp.]|uniref:hypothetical protein n=1 Tax=Anaerolinea sp. TaxID=1872519 RepID=UPI002ACEEEEA|nr:hypothetical protein [Anaerolinea sp.]
MTPTRKPLWMWLILSVGLAVLLTAVLREQIRAVVVEPLSYVIWYVQLILNTVPQPLFWAVMILGGIYLIGRAMLEGIPSTERLSEPQNDTASTSRYRYWLWYVATFSKNRFASENLARHLAHLIMEIIGHQEHLSREEMEKKIREGTLNVSEEILEFLRTRRLLTSRQSPDSVKGWLERMQGRLFHPPGSIPFSDQQETFHRLRQLVNFIEERIGGSN